MAAEKQNATKGQCLKFAALVVEHNSGFGCMSRDAIQFWIRGPGAAVISAARALEAEYEKQYPPILSLVTTIHLPAQPALTTSEEYFKEAGVDWMSETFRTQFLGLEVPATETAELAVYDRTRDSGVDFIITELGGKERATISVSQFREFLTKNRGSKEWFLFYLYGRVGKLRAVDANWHTGYGVGWIVDARSVSAPRRSYHGGRVVSRK